MRVIVNESTGETGTAESGELPSGWVDASPEQVQARAARLRQDELTTVPQQLLAAGETALNAATFGAFGGDLERQRAFAEESPVLHGIAQAVPGIAAGLTTGGAGALAVGALSSVSATAAQAAEEERDAEWSELAASGAIGGLAGPLLGKLVGRAATAAVSATGRGIARGADALGEIVQGQVGRKLATAVSDVAEVLPHVRGATAQSALKAVKSEAAKLGGELDEVAKTAERLLSSKAIASAVPAGRITAAQTEQVSAALYAAAQQADDAGRAALREVSSMLGPTSRASTRAVWSALEARAGALGEAGAPLRTLLADEAFSGAVAARRLGIAQQLQAGGKREAIEALAAHEGGEFSAKAGEALKAHAAGVAQGERLAQRAAALREAMAAGEAQSARLKGVASSLDDASTAAAFLGGAGHFGAVKGAATALRLLADQGRRDLAARVLTGAGRAAGEAVERGAAGAGRAAGEVAKAGVAGAWRFADGYPSPERAYEDRLKTVQQLASDPMVLSLEFDDAVQSLPKGPGGQAVGSMLAERSARAIAHLAATAPEAPEGSLLAQNLRPPRSAVETWGRRWEAVLDPESAIERLGRGLAGPETLETLSAVHSEDLDAVREHLLEGIAAGQVDMRRASRLSSLFGLRGVNPPLALAAPAPAQSRGAGAPNPLTAPKAPGSS